MLLVIDVGNTNIVAGVFQGNTLLDHWRLTTNTERTTDEYGVILLNLFLANNVNPKDVTAISISSVVPPLMPALERVARRYFGIEPLIVGPGTKTGLSIKVDNPREVGADLIVNAVAAREKFPGHLIVIDFGTATTYSVVTANGEYEGGVIMPGVNISAEALFQRASKLPRIEIKNPGKIIGTNTVSCMQAGMYFGYIGAVKEIVSRMKTEIGEPTTVVATGGLSTLFVESIDAIDHVEPMLTLEGLRIIYEKNRS